MAKMAIYEPAMCCPTGLCGVRVNPELLRVSTVLNNLKKNGIIVSRYNLTNAPQEFMMNQTVNHILSDQGMNQLPITVVDGQVVLTKRYPSNEEFVRFLGIEAGILSEESKPSVKYRIKNRE